ncbi:stressosome-associated protein Prli42 [Salibacterium salarium]|nr:stressosome-associated protein Prli42 [Salibacterium salarium]
MPKKFQKTIIYIMIITLVVGSVLTGAASLLNG